MSKNNNVNPGQYKVGGRERPDDIARERMKAAERSETARESGSKRRTKQTKGR